MSHRLFGTSLNSVLPGELSCAHPQSPRHVSQQLLILNTECPIGEHLNLGHPYSHHLTILQMEEQMMRLGQGHAIIKWHSQSWNPRRPVLKLCS